MEERLKEIEQLLQLVAGKLGLVCKKGAITGRTTWIDPAGCNNCENEACEFYSSVSGFTTLIGIIRPSCYMEWPK